MVDAALGAHLPSSLVDNLSQENKYQSLDKDMANALAILVVIHQDIQGRGRNFAVENHMTLGLATQTRMSKMFGLDGTTLLCPTSDSAGSEPGNKSVGKYTNYSYRLDRLKTLSQPMGEVRGRRRPTV